jgi:hypothetical protein
MMMIEVVVAEILAWQSVPVQVVEQMARERRTPMLTRRQGRRQMEQEQ